MASRYYASSNPAVSETFGGWLRQLRQNKKHAQRAVAAAADMDSSHYAKVEGDKRLLTDAQAASAARFLGVPEDEMKTRLLAAKFLSQCNGDHALASSAAGFVQEHAAPYLRPKVGSVRSRKR